MIAIPHKQTRAGIGGIAHAMICVPKEDAHKVIVKGMFADPSGREGQTKERAQATKDRMERVMDCLPQGMTALEFFKHNAFVNIGLRGVLDSAFGDLTADRITHIGLSGDSTAVTVSTTTLGTPNSIKTTANTSRTNQTVGTDQTWTQADVSFAIRKIGLLRGSAATDVSNIIGGAGGSAPYDEDFTIDLTNIATWTLTMGIDTTLTAS